MKIKNYDLDSLILISSHAWQPDNSLWTMSSFTSTYTINSINIFMYNNIFQCIVPREADTRVY